jgi:hypothetical protein
MSSSVNFFLKLISKTIYRFWLAILSLGIFLVTWFIERKNPDFNTHFSLEFAMIFLGIFFGLIFVDTYHKASWKRTRKSVYYILAKYIYSIVENLCIKLPILLLINKDINNEFECGWREINPRTRKLFVDVSKSLKGPKISNWSQDYGPDSRLITSSDVALEYYNGINHELNAIRYVIWPFIIQHPDEEQVLSSLIEFDESVVALQHELEKYKTNETNSVMKVLSEFIEKSGNVYESIMNSNIQK